MPKYSNTRHNTKHNTKHNTIHHAQRAASHDGRQRKRAKKNREAKVQIRATRVCLKAPEGKGLDSIGSVHAAHEGRIDAALFLGGNFYAANPDLTYAGRALSMQDRPGSRPWRGLRGGGRSAGRTAPG